MYQETHCSKCDMVVLNGLNFKKKTAVAALNFNCNLIEIGSRITTIIIIKISSQVSSTCPRPLLRKDVSM